MLYLESPSGVGFSYSTNTSFYDFVTDEMAARDNFVFLQHWFKKFSQYQKNEFFITGESYAGHFAPQLAELIIQTKTNINLKGIAIGNPLLEYNTNYNSRGEFLWSHGLISHSTYELLIKICNYSRIMKEYQSGKVSTTCLEIDQQLAKEVGSFMDDFDVMHEVCLPQRSQIHWWTPLQEENKRAFCPDEKVFTYLNRKEVQKALHARIGPWQSCSVLGYDIKSVDNPTISLLGTLIKLGVRVMVYSGDQDSIIPFLGTQFLLGELAKELGLNTSESFRPWYTGIKVAGSIQVYGDILSVATVKGAGHSAASRQPQKTYVLFKSFLDRKSLPKFQM